MTNNGRPHRVLIVEDNPTDVVMLKRSLVEHAISHELTVIDDGEEAIEYLAKCNEVTKPDLIIIDLNLPQKDGLDVLRKYRFSPLLVNTKMLVLTSSEAPGDRNRAELIGVDAYLQKPREMAAYLAIGSTIKELLGKT